MATLVAVDICYNKLPSLEEAHILRQAPDIDDIINGPIRDVFLKHAAHFAFSLYLQHRHRTVGIKEAVVKMGGTAHLIDEESVNEILRVRNKVVPTTWLISEGQFLTMELSVISDAATMPCPDPAFVSELISVLASNTCENLFGIDTIVKDPWSEMKIGDASVVVPYDDKNYNDADKYIPVALAFDENCPKFRVHGKCKHNHKHSSKPKK